MPSADTRQRISRLGSLRTPTALAGALAVAFLLLPRMGTDLSAAQAHRDFARAHPLTPIDLRWYGGVDQFGYSALSQHVTALTGARLAGALAAVVSAALLTDLLRRTGAQRPALGGVVGALFIFGNLVSGRIAYALGMAAGLAALDLLAARRPRWSAAAAFLTTLLSPVAGLFLGLAAGGVPLAGRRREGLLLGLAAGLPLLTLGLLFGDRGTNTFSNQDALHAAVLTALVLALVRPRAVRLAALLTLAVIGLLLLVPNPVGLAIGRLPVVFAVPLILAFVPRLWLALAVAAAATWYAPPVISRDWQHRGDTFSQRSTYAPLVAELERRGVSGRVEVVPTREYWEAALVASDDLWLARGWLRQADTRWNALFFRSALSAEAYREWIRDNAVEYVALPRGDVGWVGRLERDLLATPPPWLAPVWDDVHWRLFRVEDETAIVASPATLRAKTAASVTVELPAAGRYEVKVRYSRWLSTGGRACVRPRGDWSELVVSAPTTVTLTSALLPDRASCP